MKTLYKISIIAIALLSFTLTGISQPFIGQGINSASLSVAGNTYAFAYSSTGLIGGETLFGLNFNATLGSEAYEFKDGSGANLVAIKAVLGEGYQSILLYRMITTEVDERMPEIGRELIHDEGVALVREWINGL